VVVLHKLGRQSGLLKTAGLESLDKETTLIAMHIQFHQDQAGQFQRDESHSLSCGHKVHRYLSIYFVTVTERVPHSGCSRCIRVGPALQLVESSDVR
jgi:hypothetical protein